MLKKTIDDIKMARLTYLLDLLKTKDIEQKFKIFKKLDKIKINTKMGLELLDASTYDYGVVDGNGGINSSLVSLCIKDFKEEYSLKILKDFNKYSSEAQDRIVYMLSSVDNADALNLYVDLILKYYKKKEFIPISNLYARKENYNILFPKLFKAVSFNDYKNNILILINDYLTAGVIPDADLKKYKRTLGTAVSKIIKESFNYKFTNTSKALQNEKYANLRYFLEIVINLEYYVGNKTTKTLLDKLYKRNDNQIKLFIIENKLKKNEKIDKLDFLTIAKDNASRYPLYELLNVYNYSNLFPKTYLKQEKLAESELYLNFVSINGYSEVPKRIKYIKEVEIDKNIYYVFTFNYSYYNNNIFDSTTDYIINEAGLSKYKNKKHTATFVGISDGKSISVKNQLELNNKILWHLKKENDTIDDIVEKIKESAFSKKIEKEEKPVEEEVIVKKPRLFKYIMIFLILIFIFLVGTFILFLYKPEMIPFDLDLGRTITQKLTVRESKISNKEKFREINGHDIFTREERSYYVLFYKAPKKKEKSAYHTYINTLLENGNIVYYVDLNNKDNNFLYGENDLGFTITGDRYLQVEDGDFRFYVDGKGNILDELKAEVKSINEDIKKKKEEEKKKKQETKENNTEKKEE